MKKKKTVFIYCFCLLTATMILLFCSQNSPLYPMNDWVDVNAFFTVGKGMMNGLVPYKDLFEQISLPLYDEFIAKYSASTEFIKIIVKLLDEFDAATLQKMYEECVDKLYIEVVEETDDENSATENGIEQDSKNDEEDEKDA